MHVSRVCSRKKGSPSPSYHPFKLHDLDDQFVSALLVSLRLLFQVMILVDRKGQPYYTRCDAAHRTRG